MTNLIGFPGLGLGPFAVPNTFTIFGFTVHLYGVFIAMGVLAAFLLCNHFAKEYGLTSENLLDLILFGLPTAIIGARIYYVIFEWESYAHDLKSVFYIWEGGLAVYGGIIAGCLVGVIYCKVKKIPYSKVFDIGAFGFLIGQIFGRWGNFVNAEAFGGPTNLPWRMELVELGIVCHPTFLYESLWNLCTLILLIVFRKKMKFSGQIFLSYVTFYGLGRFWIEGLRTDSLYIGAFRASQLLAGACFIVGIISIVVLSIKAKKRAQMQQ